MHSPEPQLPFFKLLTSFSRVYLLNLYLSMVPTNWSVGGPARAKEESNRKCPCRLPSVSECMCVIISFPMSSPFLHTPATLSLTAQKFKHPDGKPPYTRDKDAKAE